MFKRLFDALRRKHKGNVASPKDAGNVSVSKEEFTPLKFEKTDEKVELAKEPVAEVQKTPIATGASQIEVLSTSVETLLDRLNREVGEEEKNIGIKEKTKKEPETQYKTMPIISDDSRLLRWLDSDQQEAVTTTEGYVRVVASAGSGKTCALTYRFAYLVKCLIFPLTELRVLHLQIRPQKK